MSNNLGDMIYTLIKGEAKLNILNNPDERFVSTYSLIQYSLNLITPI